ncbi:MAG: hypothetical protein M3458_24650 [Acidobacteriota bacterium]|nr:hypothetical protein [Acidobacteriota bacterium]
MTYTAFLARVLEQTTGHVILISFRPAHATTRVRPDFPFDKRILAYR